MGERFEGDSGAIEMTWAKYAAEFPDQCADAGLSDAAYRTHSEAIAYLYRIDREDYFDVTIPARQVRRFAGSVDYEQAIKELVASGFWRDEGAHYVLVHHAEIVRQSLAAQRKKLIRDRNAKRNQRSKAGTQSAVSADGSADRDADTATDGSADVAARQSVSHPRRVSNPEGEVLPKAVAPKGKGSEQRTGSDDRVWPEVTVPGSVQPAEPQPDSPDLPATPARLREDWATAAYDRER